MNFSRRCQRIYQIGCLACRQRGWFSECQVQHLNLDEKAGQVRRGDEFTIGLCPWHHVGEPLQPMTAPQCRRCVGPSMKHEPLRFRAVFGSDDELLEEQNRLIESYERGAMRGRRPLSEAERSHS